MKTVLYIFNCLTIVIFFSSCSDEKTLTNATTNESMPLKWVTGNYEFRSDHGTYFENWEIADSTVWYGLGYFMDKENEDTLFRQRIKLQQTPDGVFMFFNVKNQNENKIVEFRLTQQENNVFTFENPFRDYPSIVIYKMLSDSSINVVMRGFKNGEKKEEDFVINKQ